jgi:hypothetical protein
MAEKERRPHAGWERRCDMDYADARASHDRDGQECTGSDPWMYQSAFSW